MKRLILKYTICLAAALTSLSAALSARETYTVNRDWKFFTYDENTTQMVNLPHQWNLDALSGRTDYFRGAGNYMRYVNMKPEWRDRKVYIRFGGANLVTDLLVNGRYVGRHSGGSNAFVFEIGDYLNYNGRDLLWVIVNNVCQTDVMPTAGSAISYGGLFRDVEIIIDSPTSIAVTHYASDGVYVNAKNVSKERVEGEIEVKVASTAVVSASVQVNVTDSAGKTVLSTVSKIRTTNGITDVFIPFEMENPVLWDGLDGPARYKFAVTLISGGRQQDAVEVYSGFRYYEVAKDGFYLNGRLYPIRGVLMHRDRPLSGSAVDEREVLEDIAIAREMGANAIRVVGGTHNPAFYDICDRLGMVIINDLPFMGATTMNSKGFFNTEQFQQNGKEQLCEMVYQLYNHPSVFIWNLFSEVELRGENPVAYIRELNALAKRINPTRFTCGWSSQDGEINFITDLIVWSHTFGWMDGLPTDIAVWQDQLHSTPAWSSLRSAVSYKCGGSIFHQSDLLEKPLASGNWHPERWQTYFHETYLKALGNDSLFWGIFVDSLFDYASSGMSKSSGGISDMGLVSFNRQVRKDAFYLYKAAWNRDEDFVQIAEKRWARRTDTVQNIKVYSNMPEVELTVNGKFMGAQENESGIIVWTGVVLGKGTNIIEATSNGVSDRTAVEVHYSFSDAL